MLTGGLRTVQRTFALAAIEARKMTACHGRPVHTVAVDVTASRRESPIDGRFINLHERSVWRVRAGREPDDCARVPELRPPHGAVRRRCNRVERTADSLILAWVERVIRFDVRVAFAVPIGVPDERGPALRLHLVVSLVEHLRVQPTD